MRNLLAIGRQNNSAYLFKEHTHDCWEISYYYHGSGINTINGIDYEFHKGTVICQPPHYSHKEESKRGYKNYFFSLNELDLPANKPIVFKDSVNNDFYNIVHQLYYENLLDGHESIAEALTCVLVEYIKLNAQCETTVAPYIEQLRHAIYANLSNPDFSVGDEMRKFPLSLNYLRDQFDAEMGMSPKQYLQTIRVEQAKKLFSTSSLSVIDVAKLCGFSDPYYFSRFFKKVTGKSPSDYKSTL